MADIIANGEWGRDDGVKCPSCGGATYLVDDQGHGLLTYTCEIEICDTTFSIQYEWDDEDDYEDEDWLYWKIP